MSVDLETFRSQRSPQFGVSNPTRMERAFWIEMVRSGETGYAGRKRYEPLTTTDNAGPTWSFHRFGPTRTPLPDGRVVCVGGEHEDHYDPDFAIYNDVIVISPDGADVTIYGYPREVFPPTDFHTSTLAGNRIIVIGGLGYPDERGGPVTPVFELDLNTFSMSRLVTSGNEPGWIFDHRATLSDDGNAILVWGGKRQPERGRQGRFVPNEAAYRLSLRNLRWSEAARPSEESRLDIEWPHAWETAETKDDRSYEMSCLLQAAPLGHPLFAAPLLPVASSYMGRALFRLLDGTERYAVVELHGPATRHEAAPAPLTVFYNSIEDWLAAERVAH